MQIIAEIYFCLHHLKLLASSDLQYLIVSFYSNGLYQYFFSRPCASAKSFELNLYHIDSLNSVVVVANQ